MLFSEGNTCLTFRLSTDSQGLHNYITLKFHLSFCSSSNLLNPFERTEYTEFGEKHKPDFFPFLLRLS